jgi:hypothetical protein
VHRVEGSHVHAVRGLTRTARTEVSQLPGIGPRRYHREAEEEAPAGLLLDGLKVQRAGIALVGLPDVIAKALADRWSNILVPHDRAGFEAKVVAARFLLDFAVALDRVERLDGSKILHGEFLYWQEPEWPLPLGGMKEGGGAT